ncbi:hypothetical protein D3C86_1362880 [compost metagenome]
MPFHCFVYFGLGLLTRARVIGQRDVQWTGEEFLSQGWIAEEVFGLGRIANHIMGAADIAFPIKKDVEFADNRSSWGREGSATPADQLDINRLVARAKRITKHFSGIFGA